MACLVWQQKVSKCKGGWQQRLVCGEQQGAFVFLPSGQSYEIRMLDNRKIGELPEINGKLVKVSGELRCTGPAGAVGSSMQGRVLSRVQLGFILLPWLLHEASGPSTSLSAPFFLHWKMS